MAKPKETPVTEQIEVADAKVEAAVTEATEVVGDKTERLIAALGDMDHNNAAFWDTDGQPNLNYLSAVVDEPVTREEVVAIDPNFRCRPGDPDADKEAPEGEGGVVLELPPEAPKARVYTAADLKAIDAEWQEALAAKAETEAKLKEVEGRRDPIVNALAHNPRGESFAHVVQEMQRRTQETNMARVGHIKAFKELTGGQVPSLYPSKLDERAATRRSVQRRAVREK